MQRDVAVLLVALAIIAVTSEGAQPSTEEDSQLSRHLLDNAIRTYTNVATAPKRPVTPQEGVGAPSLRDPGCRFEKSSTPKRHLLSGVRPLQFNDRAGLLEVTGPRRALQTIRPFTSGAAAPTKPAAPKFGAKTTPTPKRALLTVRPFTSGAAAPTKPTAPKFGAKTTPTPKRALLTVRPFTSGAAAPTKPAAPKFGAKTTPTPKRALLTARPFASTTNTPKKPNTPKFGANAQKP